MLVVVVWLVGVTEASASTLHHPNVLGEPVDVRLSWRGDFPTVPEDGTMQSPASFPFFAAVEEGEDFQDEEEAPVQDLQDLVEDYSYHDEQESAPSDDDILQAAVAAYAQRVEEQELVAEESRLLLVSLGEQLAVERA